jgi:hypothetical protein
LFILMVLVCVAISPKIRVIYFQMKFTLIVCSSCISHIFMPCAYCYISEAHNDDRTDHR